MKTVSHVMKWWTKKLNMELVSCQTLVQIHVSGPMETSCKTFMPSWEVWPVFHSNMRFQPYVWTDFIKKSISFKILLGEKSRVPTANTHSSVGLHIKLISKLIRAPASLYLVFSQFRIYGYSFCSSNITLLINNLLNEKLSAADLAIDSKAQSTPICMFLILATRLFWALKFLPQRGVVAS
jgi:hypothetical protein